MDNTVKIVTAIAREGFQVLQVWVSDEPTFFLVHKFTPSIESQVASVDYCDVTGYDITDLIRDQSLAMNAQNTAAALMSRVRSIIETQPALVFWFHKTCKWIYWRAVQG